MKYAKVTDGTVVDVAVAEPTHAPPGYVQVIDDVNIGWVSNGQGGYVAPPVAPIAPTPQGCIDATVRYLETEARALGYDSMVTAVSYACAPEVPAYQAEGKRYARGVVWCGKRRTLFWQTLKPRHVRSPKLWILLQSYQFTRGSFDMGAMTLGTVYPTYASVRQAQGGREERGSLTITGGAVDVYFSNSATQPADDTEMTVDPNGPYSGIPEVAPAARWILVKLASGAPVVEEFRVAQVAG